MAKRKLENGEQRPAPETYPARAEIPKIADQRPAPATVTRANVAGSHTPGNNTPETRLAGCPERIRTFESEDAWQTLGRLALNFHRRKEWTFAAIGAHYRHAEKRAGWPRGPAPLAMVPLRGLGGDGGEGDANFRREISAMMTV